MDVSDSALLSGYADAEELHSYAESAMRWVCARGIISGEKHKGALMLLPREASTRAVVATMLMRFCEGMAK